MRDQSKMRHQVTAPALHPAACLPQLCQQLENLSPKEVSPTPSHAGTHLPAENLSLTGNKSGKWLKSQRDSTVLIVGFYRAAVPELSSCCLIFLSYQRNWRRTCRSPSPFLPGPLVLSSHSSPTRILPSGVRSRTMGCSSLYSAMTETQGIPLLARQVLSP